MANTTTETPLVSISCITYNHAKFIRQCLDGFLMQNTDFSFEILIHDDASTDGTEEIIREYHAKYPQIIKPLYEDENQWVKGRRGSAEFNFPRAIGKYIALCEGDDYWTDALKLQKQVEYLEQHPDYAGSCHDSIIVDEQGNEVLKLDIFADYGDCRRLSFDDMLSSKTPFSTASFVFKREVTDCLPEWFLTAPYADRPLMYLTANIGMIRRMPKTMSAYRKHEGGITSNSYGLAYSIKFLRFNYMLKRYFAPQGAHAFDRMCGERERNVIGLVSASGRFSSYIETIVFFLCHLRLKALYRMHARLLRRGYLKVRHFIGKLIPRKIKFFSR